MAKAMAKGRAIAKVPMRRAMAKAPLLLKVAKMAKAAKESVVRLGRMAMIHGQTPHLILGRRLAPLILGPQAQRANRHANRRLRQQHHGSVKDPKNLPGAPTGHPRLQLLLLVLRIL
jgi:hypothetical protein